MTEILVSVIVPFYNCEKYFEKCLTSLVNQTLKDIEIICVDDGSVDNSLEIARKFAVDDSRIKIIQQKNLKQGAARNAGVCVAQGEYIGFIDSDDWVDLDYFEKLYTTAKKYDSDIALADVIRIGNGKSKRRFNITEEKFYTSLQDKMDINKQWKEGCPTNKLYRKSLLDKYDIKFPEGVYYEDKIYTTKALYFANGVVTVPNILYFYWRNLNSTVKVKDSKKMLDKKNARLEVLNFLKENNAQLRDKDFWAVTDEKKIFGIPFITVKSSIKTKRYYLFALIKIFERKTDE